MFRLHRIAEAAVARFPTSAENRSNRRKIDCSLAEQHTLGNSQLRARCGPRRGGPADGSSVTHAQEQSRTRDCLGGITQSATRPFLVELPSMVDARRVRGSI